MSKNITDFLVWAVLFAGYLLAIIFIFIGGNRLSWLTIPLSLKQQFPLVIGALLAVTFITAALRPKKIWAATPLMVMIALLTVGYINTPDCGKDDICVIAY